MTSLLTHSPFLDIFCEKLPPRGGIDTAHFLQSIQKDLNRLLNSRNWIFDIPYRYKHVTHSILDYGMLDFSSINISSEAGQQQLIQAIQTAIRRFEPRISALYVHIISNTLQAPNLDEDLSIRFRIEATVDLKPSQERIVWDSVIEPISRQIRLTEAINE